MKTDTEILEAAIRKAIAGGWKQLKGMDILGDTVRKTPTWRYCKLTVNDDGMVGGEEFVIEEIIYDKDFARALWGEECVDASGEGHEPLNTEYCKADWHHHLQQMVIADNPIQYLGENI